MPFTHILHPIITKIKQVNVNGVRYYDTPDGTLISITSLLKSFTPEGILAWRKSVGEEAANEVMKAATSRGSKVHKIIESCLSNEPENDILAVKYGSLPARLFSQMIPALDKINMIRALETGLYSKRLGIAGTVDCVAEYEGKLSIIDFKTARRKWNEINENYLVQATFYTIAWEERTKEKIDQIVILTTTETGELSVHKDDPSKYIKRLDEMIAEHSSRSKN